MTVQLVKTVDISLFITSCIAGRPVRIGFLIWTWLSPLFGIGNDFEKARQVDFVLGLWTDEEHQKLGERLNASADAVLSFVFAGLSNTMNAFNNK